MQDAHKYSKIAIAHIRISYSTTKCTNQSDEYTMLGLKFKSHLLTK